jgi:hypothetical protein
MGAFLQPPGTPVFPPVVAYALVNSTGSLVSGFNVDSITGDGFPFAVNMTPGTFADDNLAVQVTESNPAGGGPSGATFCFAIQSADQVTVNTSGSPSPFGWSVLIVRHP